ncbi:hypothetical protein OZ410_08030 [Robiginitalea sp. M366]|uniref:hypothetical protein n=1 Tax=Robiginitalea aestuariiviva TaxID=3036903 RepID=UPI00240E84E9|nr:hypothetical protein [Robiginitalea aestuariiviva]MDG1572260.1 hypothetical protein [Robiginitalea aestuariiviva]
MKTCWISLGICLLLSCSSPEEEPRATTTLEYFENAIVIPPDPQADPYTATRYIATRGSGDRRVFRYEYSIPAKPNIADTGFTEILLFEIDPELTSFTAGGLALASLKPYYRQICYCASNDSYPVTSGVISGKRLSESRWEVTLDVAFPYGPVEQTLQVTGIFERQD